MSRWINADALIENICHTADLGGWIGDTLRNIKRLAVRYINEAPSIDIVCCRECKYSEKTSSPITALWCKRFGLEDMAVEADDFCSYGKVSEKTTGSEKPNS